MTRQRRATSLTTAHPKHGNRGFTLMEMIISIVLLGILAAVGANMISDSFTTTRIVNASQASATEARYALERLAREIREIKYARSQPTPATYCSGTITDQYCITTMTATSVVFINSANNTVTINNSGANLSLQYSAPAAAPATLNNQISNFALSYLDSNNCVTTLINNSIGDADCITRGGIRFVVITLTVTNPTSGQNTAQRTRVALRNS